MKTFSTHCEVVTEPSGFVDITEDVQKAVATAGIRSGRATVLSRRPDCAIFLNENESGLKQDLIEAFDRTLSQPRRPGTIGSASVVVPIEDGALWMGAWQRVLAHTEEPSEVVIQVCGI